MPQTERKRSRLNPHNMVGVLKNASDWAYAINQPALRRQLVPRHLIYTSAATLTTDAGTPFYPMRGGRVTAVRLGVAGAPSGSALVCDVLLDGDSMFPTSSKPEIAAGSLFGYKAVTDKTSFSPDSKLQVDITTISSATGPMVVEIEYVEEY